jgi:hypothetical protein
MTERGRLGLLQMGVRRDNGLGMGFGHLRDNAGEPVELFCALSAGPAQIETKVECDLVVAGTPGVQLPGRLADDLAQSPLDGGVNILVRGLESKLVGFRLGEDGAEPLGEGLRLLGLDDVGGAQHFDVGDGAFDIHLEETAVGFVCGESPHCLR